MQQESIKEAPSKRLVGLLAARPVLAFVAFAVVGVILIAGEVYKVVSAVSERTAVEAAVSYSAAISSIREYYSSEVVPRAKAGGVVVSHDYRDIEGAIPLPATLTIELAQKAKKNVFFRLG